jgi:hypothetical protein
MDENNYLICIGIIFFLIYLLISANISKTENEQMAKAGLQQCVVYVKGNNSNYVVWQRECKDG